MKSRSAPSIRCSFLRIELGGRILVSTLKRFAPRCATWSMPDGCSLEGLTASIGISTYPDHGVTLDQLLSSADRAMYSAKHEGRDRSVQATSIPGAGKIITLPRRRPPRASAPHLVSGG